MCVKKIFSTKRNSKDTIKESEHYAALDNMEQSLMQSETMRKKTEKELSSLLSNYEVQEHELKLTTEQNKKLKTENDTLRQEIYTLSTQCRALSNDLENLRQKYEVDNNHFITEIIDCLQDLAVIDSDSVEKPQVIKYFDNRLIRILSDLGITIIEDSGIPANPLFHRIECTIDTDKPEQSGLIAQSLGKGFKRGDRCIIEQPVAVYKNIQ
ncbi:MAG: nucleotide exchange factor GrpE [Muribaculaceae bacterium]|nr:nucleotide exchange factor GrpE [Muribaculaceae bacterium]